MFSPFRLVSSFRWIIIATMPLFLICASQSIAQVSIKERVAVQPSRGSPGVPRVFDTGVVWQTDTSGTITIQGGTGSAFDCSINQIIVLEPLYGVLCDPPYGATWNLPGNWRAGTRVSVLMRAYPGYPYQADYYPDSLAVYSADVVGFVYPGMHDDGHYTWRTTARLIRGTDFDHFLVQFNPDTIAYRDTSQIVVTAVDYGGQEVNVNPTTQLTFTLDSARFGSFINPTGQNVSSPLSGVSYNDARNGRVKFVANGARDTANLKAISLKVEGAQTTGRDTVYIGSIKLKFADKNPRKIWPYLVSPEKGAGCPGYTPKRGFVIEVKDAIGRPLSNRSIFIQTSYVVTSGGHTHALSHDTVMVDSLQGRFWSQGKTGNPIDGLETDTNGRVIIDSLRASQFSGTYFVLARLTADTTVYDSVLFDVHVDSLLQFGVGDYWNLTGDTPNHPSNHWCTQKTSDSLRAVAEDFYDLTCTPEGGGTPTKLRVNDISLQWGGDFDIDGGWYTEKKHMYHRIGQSADFNGVTDRTLMVTVVQADGSKKGVLTKLGEKLEGIMDYYGAKRQDEPESIHFGFGGSN